MRHKEFWIALGIGALAGGIAALLYAPDSGEQTRRKLKRGLEDAGDALEEAAEYMKQQAEKLSEEVQRLVDHGKGQVDDAVDSAATTLNTATKLAKGAQKLV